LTHLCVTTNIPNAMADESNQLRSNVGSPRVERKLSSPVRPAVWMTSVLVWASVVGIFLNVPLWAGIFLCSLTGLSFLSFLVPYTYLMIQDRETLRRDKLLMTGSGVNELRSVEATNQMLVSATEDLVLQNENVSSATQKIEVTR